MGDPWSSEEVEAIVADYFAMFVKHLHKQEYNKTEHRRALLRRLEGRSARAVEDKHMNISAALNDLGFPHIPGYKPLRNYQHLLRRVVADRLDAAQELRRIVGRHVEERSASPVVKDILKALVAAPRVKRHDLGLTAETLARHFPSARGSRTDYLAREAANRSLGREGEEFVVKFERARLKRAGRREFANRVEQVSETCGDYVGFDVLSYDEDGGQRLIEVKTTRYAKETPFYVTGNELAVSRERADHYHLYRVFEFSGSARFFNVRGALDEVATLVPVEFRGTVP